MADGTEAEKPLPPPPSPEAKGEGPEPEVAGGQAAAGDCPESASETAAPPTPLESAPPTPSAETTCCSCRKTVTLENSVVQVRSSAKQAECRRCRSCHAVRSAIQRLGSKHGNLVSEWGTVSGSTLQDFYQRWSHLRGDKLREKLEETVEEHKKEVTRVEFNQEMLFFDETDLTKRYENKPDQLKNIIENGRKYFCNVRKCTLYGDPNYTAKVQDSEERGVTRKRKFQIAEDMEAGGQSKEQPHQDEKTEENEKQKKMTASQRKKLEKKLEACKTKKLHVLDLLSTCTTMYKGMVPEYVTAAAEEAAGKSAQSIEAGSKKLQQGKQPVEATMASLETVMEALQEAHTRMKMQIDQAAQFKK